MTTLVGKDKDFNEVVVNLLELEYDNIGAYKLAVKKLFNPKYKNKMNEFLLDHNHHLEEIKGFYSAKLPHLPDSGDLVRGVMIKMKVSIGDITGFDYNILKAILDNEIDTNTAYERIVGHPRLPDEVKDIFERAYQDEKKHKQWLETTIDEERNMSNIIF